MAESIPSDLAFAEDEMWELPSGLRLGLVRSDSLLPAEVALADQSSVILSDLLYDGLTEISGGDGALRPGLADRWVANDDFTSWTFELAPTVTAAEVVASFRNWVLDPEVGDPVVRLAAGIETVTAVDDRTVRFDLDRSSAGFPWLMSGLPYSVVGPEGRATGRYEIVSDDTNGMVLDHDGDGPDVMVTWADDEAEAYDLLTLALVDAAVADPVSVVDAGRRYGAEFPARAMTRFHVVSPESEALSTVEVRRAVVGALDRAEIAESTLSASVVAADGLVADTVSGYRPNACGELCGTAGSKVVDGDPEVRSDDSPAFDGTAGLGVALVVGYTGADQDPAAEMLVSNLRDAGFRVDGRSLSPDELAAAVTTGDVDLFSFGMIPPAGSADAIVPLLLQASSPMAVARPSSAGDDDADLDVDGVQDVLARAMVTVEDEARWDLYHQAQRLVIDDGRVVPVVAAASTLARAPHVAKLVVRSDGSIDLNGP